jgi:hypothetical protein
MLIPERFGFDPVEELAAYCAALRQMVEGGWLKDGILILILPKSEAIRPKMIKVTNG